MASTAPSGDLRQATRHAIDHRLVGERRGGGEIVLHVANVSASGFLVLGRHDLAKGERITVRFPAIGRIEAFVVWNSGSRAGLQFERVLRPQDLRQMLALLDVRPGSRRER